MKSRIKTEPRIVIELNQYEAEWLMKYVQNDPSDYEEAFDVKVRSELFNVLKNFKDSI